MITDPVHNHCNLPVSEPGDRELDELLVRNAAWAASKTSNDPTFFHRLVEQQRPRYFWIGCSDSRVPATEIVDLDPGEMFVHRNVANLALEHDPSFAAALQFAVETLEVSHIMVVGHYGCGGIQAALEDKPEQDDPVARWIEPIRGLRSQAVETAENSEDRAARLCEANVLSQVDRVIENSVVRQAWDKGRNLTVSGYVYRIEDGLLKAIALKRNAVSGESAFSA